MNYRNILVYVVLLFPLSGCEQDKSPEIIAVEAVRNTSVELRPPPVELTSHLYIVATVNDSIDGVFLFDTGANDLILDRTFAMHHALDTLSTADRSFTYGAGEGKLAHEYLSEIQLKFDGREFTPEKVRMMALDSMLGDVLDHRIDGIIGYDLFKDFIAKIDFDEETFTLLNRLPEDFETYSRVQYKIAYRKPMVTVEAEIAADRVITANVLFDMGSADALALTHRKAKQEQLFSVVSDDDCSSSTSEGIGGSSSGCSLSISSLRIDKTLKVDSINVWLGKDQKGALGLHDMYDGVLGLETIRLFDLLFDPGQRSIYFRERLVEAPNTR
ncbi:retropepsin-like aspartic protease [Lewinella sp. 4G2]|uniref:retropepsin-like aspartic protease n=1 Tax=Lewinella sp. 4G2 TaxID=1803372 RepID=UPI0007B476A5|nr:retropepsin-like aspartic protease [Lewinella sp. 4G2]OAV45269.1 hypothetical protein A3850_012540 [Lewinella sp. 4G2]